MLDFFYDLADRKKNRHHRKGLLIRRASYPESSARRDQVLYSLLSRAIKEDDPMFWDVLTNHLIECKQQLSCSFLKHFIVVCPVLAHVTWAKSEYDRKYRERYIQSWNTIMDRGALRGVSEPRRAANNNAKHIRRPANDAHRHINH